MNSTLDLIKRIIQVKETLEEQGVNASPEDIYKNLQDEEFKNWLEWIKLEVEEIEKKKASKLEPGPNNPMGRIMNDFRK